MLKDFILNNKCDVIFVTETHLLSHIPDSFVSIPDYNLFRNDMEGKVPKHGVCVYVHRLIMVDSVDRPLPNTLSFHLSIIDVHCLVVYRAPSNTPSMNDAVIGLINRFCTGREVLVAGDFNLPSIDWSVTPPTATSSTDLQFLDTFTTLGLTQWVLEPTYPRSGNILDLFLTSEPDRVGECQVPPPLPGCDHCPTEIKFTYTHDQPQSLNPPTSNLVRSWHRGNYRAIAEHLSTVDWDFEFYRLSADDSFNCLNRILQNLICDFIPQHARVGEFQQKRPPPSLVNMRHAAWLKYKSVRHELGRRSQGASIAYSTFSDLNKQVRRFSVASQAEFEESLVLQSKDRPKLLHSYIRNKKKGRPSVGPIKLSSGQLTDDPAVMVECFASSFSSVYTRECPNNPFPHQTFDGMIDTIDFSTSRVREALERLDGNTSSGPDGIHPLLLKRCANQLTYPLHVIFQRSFSEGQLPSDWKSSLVTPIFKKGSRNDPLNYRPISTTSVCGKMFERIICEDLTSYLESNSILTSHQFGFRAGRSTMDQLLLVYDNVSKYMDKGGVIDVILFDFSKAFDVVVHQLLLDKLQSLGIHGHILQSIQSFLTNRIMRVGVQGHASKPCPVLSGVPQGSVLGPLLFLIYINSIASGLSSNYKIFADDLKVYACIHHPDKEEPVHSSPASVQRDIDVLCSTAASWGLHMNVNKCAVLRFARSSSKLEPPPYTLNGVPIPAVESASDLGVLVDTGLKFHAHIRSVTHKAGGLAHSFLKSTVCRSRTFMLFLLTTHIRPLIEYCSCIWHTGFAQDYKLLENIQRRWTKQIDGLGSLPYRERLESLNLYSIQGRLLRADLIQCWKIFNGHSCILPADLFQQPPQKRTRGHSHKIFPPVTNTDVRKRSFTIRCISTWNSLSSSTVCATSLTSFKRGLDRDIGELLYAHTE